ncbi:MAG: asparagine synthase (glutamine-hydrolyzing) [Spirochaetota bacterium]
MGGITGAIELKNTYPRSHFAIRRLKAMAEAIKHRGPDKSTIWHQNGIAMAVNRLELRGGIRGKQPLADANKQIFVSANAEIYNTEELSQTVGMPRTIQSDTELWPSLYLKYGEDLFGYINGQFAVAIYDSRDQSLLLARDRQGILPLYYTVAGDWLLWGSEAKALLASGLVTPEADLSGINHIFTFFASGSSTTCFKNISSIPTGSYLKIKEGRFSEHSYARFRFTTQIRKKKKQIISDSTEILQDSVKIRMQANDPVGFYLSAGLDSSLLVGIAAKLSKNAEDLQTFGLAFDKGLDECVQAEQTATEAGAPLHCLYVDEKDLFSALPRVIGACENPIMDTSTAAFLLLAEFARSHGCKAVITGEGADELFAGYPWNRLWNLPGSNFFMYILGRMATPDIKSKALAKHLGSRNFAMLHIYNTMYRARQLFYSQDMLAQLQEVNPFTGLGIEIDDLRKYDSFHRSIAIQNQLMLSGHLLSSKGDRIGMHSTLETRYPFLDKRFVELANSLSPDYKAKGLQGKWLLHQIAYNLGLHETAKLPKTMFKTPPICQMQNQPIWVEELLSPPSLAKTGYFSAKKVAIEKRVQQVKAANSIRRYASDGAFTAVVMTQLWHHMFLGGGLCSLPSLDLDTAHLAARHVS